MILNKADMIHAEGEDSVEMTGQGVRRIVLESLSLGWMYMFGLSKSKKKADKVTILVRL